MKLFEIPMVVTSLLGFCFLPDAQVPTARADFAFGARVLLGPPVNSDYTDSNPTISPNGLELYFASTRPGGYGQYDIWTSKRASVEDPWGPPVNPGPGINSAGNETPDSISSDGLTLYVNASPTLYTTTRPTIDAPWGPRVNMGPVLNSGGAGRPIISPDDLDLYFYSSRAGGLGGVDIYVSTRATRNDPWGPPVNLGPTINTAANDAPGAISPDGLTLFIVSDRPGGVGGWDTWMTWRLYKGAPWSAPVNLGPSFNTSTNNDLLYSVSADGRWAYIGDIGQGHVWMAPILPTLDFTGDGKVDAADMDLLMADWGKSNSVCDIGPYPWGDGVVDEKDLKVLMESLLTPGPQAADVPCDVSLSWVAAPTAKSDVYLGTSADAVTNASRANPQSVLVSQGQTPTTYAPPALLDFGRTYYWRIDFVVPGPTPTIYPGPVLKFTTAALVYPIKNVIATASSAQAGCGPERTVDGSGLDKSDGHSTEAKDMWWSLAEPSHWIQYEFDKLYPLHELWVWNFNSMLEPFMGFGAKTVKIEYSTDGTAWTPLANVPEFKKAPGKAGYTPDTIVSFGGVSARFVKLTIDKNWGVAPQTGLSEVRFFAIQSTAAPKP